MAGGLVGREAELAAVERFLEEADRSNVALMLDGEPGIGKTAIWRQALQRASERGLRILTTRPAEAEARLSYAALGDLVGTAYAEVRGDLPAPQRQALDVALLREVSGGRTDPRTIGTGLVTMLHALSASAPVLLAVDDVQWLDRASERALSFAVRRLPQHVSLLVTRRSERVARPPFGLAESLGPSSVEHTEIGPLSIAALYHVIRAEIGAAPPRPMLVRIASASGGNPFYALEIARMLSHDGSGVVRGAPLPISDRLHEFVAARVAGISESSREVLLAVAALSRPSHSVLAAAFGSTEVEKGLAEAGDAGVITTDGSAIEFTHPLLASAVYASASPDRRRRVHQRLADVVSDIEESARHLANAATVPDGVTAAKVERAAELAASRGAQDAAADLFGAAVRLTPPEGSEEATRRLTRRSAALLAAGDLPGARSVAESALELATDAADLAEALLLLGEIAWVESPGRQPIEFLENALAHAGDDRRLRGRIHAKMAEYSLLDQLRVLEHSDAAAELLDEDGDPALLASALLNKAFFSAQLGHGAPHDLVERAFRLEERAGPDVERNRVGLIWLTCMDETEAARARHRIEDEWYRDRGEDGWRAERLAHLALAEFYVGDWQDAERAIEQSCTTLEQMGQPAGPWGMTFYIRSVIDLHQGRAERARPTLLALREELERVGHPFFSAIVLSALGSLELVSGEPRAAATTFQLMHRNLDAIGAVDPIGLRTDPDEIDALVALGALDAARAVLEQLETRNRTITRPWTAIALPRARALVVAAEGDPAAALQALDELDLDLAERVPLEHGRTLLAKGRLHRRLKQRRLAGEVLGEARERFARLGAVTWEQAAKAELARTGVRRPAPGELTASELRVAELAAAGLTNREVAKAAFMSPKTVEANLARVYRKLGIKSRAELGARMTTHAARGHEELQA
ncbi:MAG TPA: AAA family ATPase [Gaiellaceae bacterium]|nr:AAA family ATPase [Gaiellaceae bacterium]